MIRGITFSEQAFYSADFAHYQNFFLNRQSGITKGCNVSQDGEKVTIGTGYFIAHGRLLNVEEPEVITESAGFAAGYNRIVYEIDLSKENSITKFQQGSIKVLQTEDLIQEDLDNGGKVYQMPFCHFQWSGARISDFIIDAPTLVLDNIFADVSANFETVNEQFKAWLEDQHAATETWTEEQKTASKAAMDNDVSEVNTHATTAKKTIDDFVNELSGATIGANAIGYDSTTSKLNADTVQSAIDELASEGLIYLGQNPDGIKNDIPSEWAALGNGYATISIATGGGNVKIETGYDGFLVNRVDSGLVSQEWHDLSPNGTVYKRAGVNDQWYSTSDDAPYYSWTMQLNDSHVISFENGGTNADSLVGARSNLTYLGLFSNTAFKDRPRDWAANGTGIAYIYPNVLTDQPVSYGLLINLCTSDSLYIHQVFISNTSGTTGGIWQRTGAASADAWGSSWSNSRHGIQIERVWNNASPTSSFAAQTIEVNANILSSDLYMLVCNLSTENIRKLVFFTSGAYYSDAIWTGNIATADAYLRTYLRQWVPSTSEDSFTITDAKSKLSNGTTVYDANSYLIPLSIYRIKGVRS